MSKTKHPIADELLNQLLANYQMPEDLIGADGLLKQLTKKLVERALDAELTHHLGHDKQRRHLPAQRRAHVGAGGRTAPAGRAFLGRQPQRLALGADADDVERLGMWSRRMGGAKRYPSYESPEAAAPTCFLGPRERGDPENSSAYR